MPLHRLSLFGDAVVDLGFGRVVVTVVDGRVVVVVLVVVVDEVLPSVDDAGTALASFKITSSGGGSASPKRDFVTQQRMPTLQRPSTLSTASQKSEILVATHTPGHTLSDGMADALSTSSSSLASVVSSAFASLLSVVAVAGELVVAAVVGAAVFGAVVVF